MLTSCLFGYQHYIHSIFHKIFWNQVNFGSNQKYDTQINSVCLLQNVPYKCEKDSFSQAHFMMMSLLSCVDDVSVGAHGKVFFLTALFLVISSLINLLTRAYSIGNLCILGVKNTHLDQSLIQFH